MEHHVRKAISGFTGEVFLFAKNLDTGEAYGIRQDQRVRTASTIKLPIMVAVFAAEAEGKVRRSDELVLTADSKVSGSGVLTELSDGMRLALRDLVRLMIVVSDNTATNLVLDAVPGDFVNQQMDKLGLGETRSLRKILGDGAKLKPTPSGLSKAGEVPENKRFGIGVSTPREMVMLLEKLERGEVVSAPASKEMIGILKRQQFKDGIGRKLLDEKVVSKSGSLDQLRSDAGIVYSDGGRIAIAITVDSMPKVDYSPDNAGLLLISRLTGYLLEGLARHGPK